MNISGSSPSIIRLALLKPWLKWITSPTLSFYFEFLVLLLCSSGSSSTNMLEHATTGCCTLDSRLYIGQCPPEDAMHLKAL